MHRILLLIILSNAMLFAQGFNMDLISTTSYGQDASDITGFAQDGREFAVMGLQNSAVFIDITDPYNPVELGRISGGNSIWRDIKYFDRHVYIGTEAADGVKIVSVDNPDNPVLVNTITDFTNSHNIHIADGYLYVVGAGGADIYIYSLLLNPSNPGLVGTWSGEYQHDITVYNDKIYGAGIYNGHFYIIDVSDKSNPTTLVDFDTGGGYISTHDTAVTPDENYLFTGDENTGGHVKIFDISDYDNINLVAEYQTNPNHSAHNLYWIDDMLVISYYADGTRVLDVSDPTNPSEIAYYDFTNVEGLYVGNWGTYPYLPSGNIISSDIECGCLHILQMSGMAELDYTADTFDYNLSTGESAGGTITLINAGEEESTLSYSASIQAYSNLGSGLDEFGYGWTTDSINDDVSFDWVELTNSATQVSFSDNDSSTPDIDIGFDFPFYGESYSSLTINPNGWLGFGTSGSQWDNENIPSSSIGGPAILPFWDDLNPTNNNCNEYCGGNVYYESYDDHFIVWFDNVAHWWTNFNNCNYTFQVIINKTGEIELNYQDVSDDSSASIGIQGGGNVGQEIQFNSSYISSSNSVLLNTPPSWLSIDGGSTVQGTLEAGAAATVYVQADASDLDGGSYMAYVGVQTNTSTDPVFPVMVSIEDSMPGDVTGDGVINILDVVQITNIVLGLSDPTPVADLNGDGAVDILDVITLVNIILQG